MTFDFVTWQWIIFWWVLLLIFLLSLIRHWIRYFFVVVLSVIAGIVLLTLMFPLYQKWPNLTPFYSNTPAVLSILPGNSASTSAVMIRSSTTTQLNTLYAQTFPFPLSAEATLSFVASQPTDPASVFLLLPQWTLIQIFPQTQIHLQIAYPRIVLQKFQWMASYSSWDVSSPWVLSLSWIVLSTWALHQLQIDYASQKNAFLTAQAPLLFLQNPYLKAINEKLLVFLAWIWPSQFAESLDNFNAFSAYVSSHNMRVSVTSSTSPVEKDMLHQASRWWEETQLYQRRKKIFQ